FKVLNKRILRDLNSIFPRYLALFLLIAMGMYIIVAMIASAETIILGTEENAKNNHLEDGQFAVFTELTAAQEKEISDMGITLEKMFSFDADMADGSVLRIFRNRENIDIVSLEQGVLAEKGGEICLEKRYCEENNISVGDVIKIGGDDIIVTGIGTALDYDAPTKNISDASVQSKIFGIGFVVEEQYDVLKNIGKTEDMRYAYRLNGKASHNELKEKIKSFEFDIDDITDKFLLEMLEENLQKKDDIQNGISDLKNGSEELADGLSELDKNGEAIAQFASEYAAGVSAAYDGSVRLSEGIAELQKETNELIEEIFEIDIDNLTEFIEAENNPRIGGCASDVAMNKSIGLLIGIILIALFSYVISVFVIHQIQRESSVIGALYALGAKKKSLIFHYVL
ncbi:MAG: ABC transporter permease, partial [Oscillospiraceae bacterium]|nr:ABC transporter permease [Oscillospiraceae bacterium]